MSGIVARLAALVDAGQLTPADVLQYANYPDRLLSAQERSELGTLVSDMTRIVPQGRSDGPEYVNQSLNNAEYEAQFAAGLVRKGSLGFASESDMDQNWEGAYFSMYHPAELNPQLRLFANQLNSKVSLVRPTTQRNQSVPMFLTPGIERDPMGARVNMQLNQISSQQASLSQALAQKRLELSRLTKLGQSKPQAIAALETVIKQLEAQIGALDISRRQVHGTSNAYLDNTTSPGEEAPAVEAVEADPVVNVEPSAPPVQADILGLDPGSDDKHANKPLPLLDAPSAFQLPKFIDRKLLYDTALGIGNAIAGASGVRNGPSDTQDAFREFQGVDNAEGGSGGGRNEGEAPRPVIDRPPVADGYAGNAGNTSLLETVSSSLRPSLSWLGAQVRNFDQRLLKSTTVNHWDQFGLAGTDWLQAPLSSVPGIGLSQVPVNETFRNVLQMEELAQREGSFQPKHNVSEGLGSEHRPPGTNPSIAGNQSVNLEALEAQARYNDFYLGPPDVPGVAGGPDGLPDPFRGRPDGSAPVGVRLTAPSGSSKSKSAGLQSTSLVAPTAPEKKQDTSMATLRSWIRNAPQKVLKMLNNATDNSTQIMIMEQVLRAWQLGAIAAAAMPILAANPIVREYLILSNIDPNQVGTGKRKRSVSRGRGRGRGSVKRHRH